MLKWNRGLGWLLAALFVALFFWLLPPFHIIPLGQEKKPARFDPATFAREFWTGKLLPATGKATPLGDLLPLLATDPAAARKHFGRSPGISSSTYFFVQGSGEVIAVSKDRIQVRAAGGGTARSVELLTGLLFGNLVRDSSGLLDVNDFPNSQEFNAISTELNRLVETQVLPALRERAQVGKTVRFAGCLEVESGSVPETVAIVPVKVEWP